MDVLKGYETHLGTVAGYSRKKSAPRGAYIKPLERGHIAKPPHQPTEYCEKFDNACRERIRNKYNRVCFYCGKDEYTNNAKLSVHHLDMNKDQGCNGHEWRLVPLCRTCHGKAHTDTMTAKLKAMYAQIVN